MILAVAEYVEYQSFPEKYQEQLPPLPPIELTYALQAMRYHILPNKDEGDLTFYAGNDATILSNERMRITKDGNIGIGTSSPTEKLEVNGNQKTSGEAAFGGYNIDSNYTVTTPSLYSGKGEFGELCIVSYTL
jgi:hypothetical protein